jgi:G3E family GTPase
MRQDAQQTSRSAARPVAIRAPLPIGARPFHPERLAAAIDGWHGLLRSKGFCHIASRPDVLAVWSQAGPNLVLEPGQLLGAHERTPARNWCSSASAWSPTIRVAAWIPPS